MMTGAYDVTRQATYRTDAQEHRGHPKPACEKAWENSQGSQRNIRKSLAISWLQLPGCCLAANSSNPCCRSAFVDFQGVTHLGEHKKHPGIVGKTSVNFGTFSSAASLLTIEQ
jgi:hypothetical protein